MEIQKVTHYRVRTYVGRPFWSVSTRRGAKRLLKILALSDRLELKFSVSKTLVEKFADIRCLLLGINSLTTSQKVDVIKHVTSFNYPLSERILDQIDVVATIFAEVSALNIDD